VIRNAACVISGIKGATALAVTIALISGAVKSHPYTNHIVTLLDQERSGNR
jgi:hypothetical protein